MDPSCLRYTLTHQERRQFEQAGYLVVENAVATSRLDRLVKVCDRLLTLRRQAGPARHASLSEPDVIGQDPVLVEMVDCETTFPKVWGILGWNIYLYHSHIDVTPPSDPEPLPGSPTVAWHQDSLRVNDEIESSPRPRLSLKIGYYLSDVSEPGRGNTLIVPGSHLKDEIEVPADQRSNPPGSIPICVSPGDAVIIDRRLWHSRSRNESDITRRVLWMGYSYRWLRPKDEMTVKHLYSNLDPIQRQLLGSNPSNNGCYAPTAQDVPLLGWLHEHCPADATWTLRRRRQSFRPDIAPPIQGAEACLSTGQGEEIKEMD